MRALLGFCVYYSAYTQMWAEHAAPLTKLLHVGYEDGTRRSKKALAWTPESENLLDEMNLLCSNPSSYMF